MSRSRLAVLHLHHLPHNSPALLRQFAGIVVAPVLAVFFACDPGDRCIPHDGVSPDPAVDLCAIATDTGVRDADGLDSAIGADTSGTTTEYPPGPYGTAAGEVAANRVFETSDGTEWSFAALREDTDAGLIFVSTAAGWCTACIEEQPALVALHDEFADSGLRIAVAVFEDARNAPATAEYAARWRERHALPFPVLVDTRNQFGAFYDSRLAPMNLFVATPSMEIVGVTVGFDETRVRALITAHL